MKSFRLWWMPLCAFFFTTAHAQHSLDPSIVLLEKNLSRPEKQALKHFISSYREFESVVTQLDQIQQDLLTLDQSIACAQHTIQKIETTCDALWEKHVEVVLDLYLRDHLSAPHQGHVDPKDWTDEEKEAFIHERMQLILGNETNRIRFLATYFLPFETEHMKQTLVLLLDTTEHAFVLFDRIEKSMNLISENSYLETLLFEQGITYSEKTTDHEQKFVLDRNQWVDNLHHFQTMFENAHRAINQSPTLLEAHKNFQDNDFSSRYPYVSSQIP
ncbi:MAG: hypothetical protein R3A11_04540 [Bdellovibrionota bacterium]